MRPIQAHRFSRRVDAKKPSLGTNYELLFAQGLLLQGYRVFLLDYVGMGTPGIHTYANRVDQGHAVLDAARAALRFSGLRSDSPVGLWGYSQGGGAVASAAELASSYAPELNVRATYAGAPPADLLSVTRRVDGTAIVGVLGYAINGLTKYYPQLPTILDREANAEGRRALRQLSHQCIVDSVLQFGFVSTRRWTTTGEPLWQVIKRHPALLAAVEDQQIGRLRPDAPVLLESAVNDDAVGYDQVAQLAKRWQSRGAHITLLTDRSPPIFPRTVVNHVLAYAIGQLPAYQFLHAHLAS